jgi:3-oxoacyl-[acyl-carrier-protein] synthase-3
VNQRLHYVKQEGQTVFKFAVRNMEEVCTRILERNNIKPCQVDLFAAHQANRRIILSTAEKLGMPLEKVIINIDRYGNTTGGTIPLVLNEAIERKRLKRGDLVLCASVGAGFTVGAVLMRWGLKQQS